MSENWFKWGVYCTLCVESGVTYPSKKIIWDTVESDFLLNSVGSGRLYGGGIGLIQVTSKNYQMLRQIVTDGYDMTNFPSGSIKTQLTSGNKTSDWFQYSTKYPYGLFTANETKEIKKMLRSEQGQKANIDYMVSYFQQDNAYAYSQIKNSSLDDKGKAFLVNLIVLAPAYVQRVLSTGAKTLNQLKTAELNQIGWSQGYINRCDTIINILNQININSNPPIDIDNFENDNEPTNTDNNQSNGGNSETGTPPPKEEKPLKYELTSGLFYLKNNMLYCVDSNFKMIRYKDYFILEPIEENEENVKQKENEKEKETVLKPSEENPNSPADKNGIVEQFVNELLKVPLNSVTYSNNRPGVNPIKFGIADCSSFVAWGLRNLHPKVWNNGYVNTGTIFNIFKNNGYLIWQGGNVNQLKDRESQGLLKHGDILEFSDDNTFGAGNDKHVGIYLSGSRFLDMNGGGNMIRDFKTVMNFSWYQSGFNHTCQIRIVK